MQSNGNKFEYSYAAPTEAERKEIVGIRREYEENGSTPSDKMNRLRMLHSKVRNTATAVSLVIGIVGALITGAGMAMVMEMNMLVWGIVVGIVGLIPIAVAYPAYSFTLSKCREKYGSEILKISGELLKSENKETEAE